MSDIANRLVPTDIGNGPTTQLNPGQFSTVVMAYLIGDITGMRALTTLNALLASNQAPPLTQAEQDDVIAMKAHYDTLNNVQRSEYRDKLYSYTVYLHDSVDFPVGTRIEIDEWDATMGLGS